MATLTLTEFFDLLPISSMTFELGDNLEISETGAGQILTSARGVRLYRGEVTLSGGPWGPMQAVREALELARKSGNDFLISDLSRSPVVTVRAIMVPGSFQEPTIRAGEIIFGGGFSWVETKTP